ncbi:hypothetical protein [Thermosipho sp. (in: thermotogales)]|jgi:hypothetical protein|uniref:hypothetical protein n=1 Tax=Thermosipho sp. (in: thermotogales) TaxID=1968895 RepID=UPI00257A5BF7|nr:hypothetical protein [Thermosipho sp. (in: thermotogales)]MBZ4649146.1 hypothetical protein [Thermosipho sp. (in: thermotogales)]
MKKLIIFLLIIFIFNIIIVNTTFANDKPTIIDRIKWFLFEAGNNDSYFDNLNKNNVEDEIKSEDKNNPNFIEFIKWFLFDAGSKESPNESIIKSILIDQLLDTLVNKIIYTDTSFLTNKTIRTIYNTGLKIICSLFVILLTYLGLIALLGHHIDYIELIYKFIAINVLFLIIPKIINILISFNNVLTKFIISSTVGKIDVFKSIGTGKENLLFIVFIIITTVLIIRLLIYYYIRWFEIIFIYLFSPYAMYLWLGGNQNILKICLKELITLIFTPTIHSIQLAIYIAISLAPPKTFSGPFDQLLLMIASMLVMLKTPIWLNNIVHQIPDSSGFIRQLINLLTFSRERTLLRYIRNKL